MSEQQDTVDLAAPPAALSSSEDNQSVASSAAATAPSTVSSTRPSSLPKPSGLKPPTRIGRPCSNATPKPAVPQSPRGDGGSSDTVRKLSDDLSRKHLSDLIEAEEDEVTSSLPERHRAFRKASTGSAVSGISMDALWEKHPRRLSEAGLRRHSDHSVVLTEDTDSFIIGERVWVGGTKPGQIAYIGETQFAPGDWAGIVLDDAIGKNDGSVAGVRYFQCSEKRGVFSRLTRLTRAPLFAHDASPASDASSVFERPPSGMGRPRRTLSPNGSIRSVVSSKMNASITTTTGGSKEVGLGERVIVSSSRGSKAGTLRYVGVTDFAPGVWAGVELDDPLGKNDGSVDGKRYFECSPRFGLFAPISKVSRSPSSRKPGACAIHSNGRATPLRRSNSRDSLTSLGTSIASSRAGVRLGVTSLGAQRLGPRAASTPVSAKNALQEILREKQSHLERLMRERELERSEMAKLTLQADRAEAQLGHSRREAAQVTTEKEKLKSELELTLKMLEDERQKVEDLMFRNEEENINKEDYYKYKEAMEKEKAAHEQRIRQLEAQVSLEIARSEAATAAARAMEERRTAEAATVSEQHREELAAAQTLSSELQKLLDEAYALLREKENEKDSLGKSRSEELSKLKAESEKALSEARTKIAIAQTEFEAQMSVLTGKLQLAESKLESEKSNVERLNKENSQIVIELNARLSQLQAVLDDKMHELNKVTGSSKEHELNLNKELTKLKMELSAKILDLEQLTDSHKKQDSTYKSLQEEIAKVRKEHSSKINEYESMLNEVSQQNEKNKTEIIQLQQSLNAKTKDYERLLNESSTSSTSTEKLITEFKETIHERDKEIIRLKDEYEQATANFNINHSKIAEEHKKEIDERNTKIEQLLKEIDGQKKSLEQRISEFEALNLQFTTNVDELKILKDENEQLKKSITELTQVNANYKEKIASMELEIGELKRQFDSTSEKCIEMEKAKDKIESEYMNLTGQATDSNEQFNKLSQHLKDTEKELKDLKDKHRETTNTHGRIEQELKQRLFKVQEEFSLERAQLVKLSDDNIEKIKGAGSKVKELEVQLNDFRNHLKEQETKNDQLLDENTNLKQEMESQKAKENELTAEYQTVRKQMEADIDRYKQEVSLLKAEGATSEVKLMEKVDQLIEAQNDLNNKLEEARRHEDALQKVIDDMTATLNNQKSQFEAEIVQLKAQLTSAVTEAGTLKSEETRLREILQEKEKSVKELTLKIEMIEVDLKSNLEVAKEKERQLTEVNEELKKSVESKKKIEVKLNNILSESATVKQLYENLIANSSAEESLLKEQQTQVETLRKDITVLNQDKITLESKCKETLEELSKLRVDYENTVKLLTENSNNAQELQKAIEEKDRLLKTQCDRNESDSNKINALDVEVAKIKQELLDKNTLLEEKDIQLKKLHGVLQAGSSEAQQQVKLLQDENTQLSEKYKSEIEALNVTCKTLQSRITEQDKQLEDLEKSKNTISDLQTLLTKSESDIKQLTSINEGQKLNYEDLNQQLQYQFDEYKRDAKKMKHDYKAKIGEYEKELQTSKDSLKAELEKHTQLQQKITESEKNISELSNKLELAAVQNVANVGKEDQLEKLTLELQGIRKTSAEALANSEATINRLKVEVENKVKDLKQKEDILTKLQEELKNQRAKAEISEREKVLLHKELANKNVVKDKNDNSAAPKEDNQSQNEETVGQVSFLNAVIVDMQRKNEQLTARLRALEEPAPLVVQDSNGRKSRPAPRLFCDICDVFDAHDTDDCPRQATAGEPERGPRKTAPPPRDYCDICEVFGHSTENCDEEETF